MTEPNGEMSRIQALDRHGVGKAEAFLLSPPLSDGEIDALTPGISDRELSDDKAQRLRKLEDSGVMERVSIISGEVEINGTRGSLLVVEAERTDGTLPEDMALIGSTVCILRDEPTLDLRLVPR